MVVGVDLARIRDTPAGNQLLELAVDVAGGKARIDDLTSRTGLHPLRQIRSAVLAFPEDADRDGLFGAVIRGEGFDARRLIAYARDQVKKDGYDIEPSPRGERTLWTETREGITSGFFLDYQTFVIGSDVWADKLADLADRVPGVSNAETDADLVGLCRKAEASGALWAAAVVPAATRRRLRANPEFHAAASVTRLRAGVALGAGLDATVVAELSNAPDAVALAGRVTASLREARRNPRILMMGLGPYLDAVSVKAAGPSVVVAVKLTASQAGDLAGRLRGRAAAIR